MTMEKLITHSHLSLHGRGVTLHKRFRGLRACLAGIAIQILQYANDIVLISDCLEGLEFEENYTCHFSVSYEIRRDTIACLSKNLANHQR